MRKRALLIGINAYNHLRHVSYAKDDAVAVAEVLQDVYHFDREEIVLMTDQCPGIFTPSQNNIEEQILALRRFESLDFLLFGFWGHGGIGVIDNQFKRYLCVQDTSADPGRLQRTAVSLGLVLDVLKQTAAPQTCVLLDCCQNVAAARGEEPTSLTQGDCDLFNQGARDIVAASRSKHHVNPDSNPVASTTIILNSCSAMQRAFEWTDRKHGIFTAHLLDAMTAGPSVSRWAHYVSERVPLTAINYGHTQDPYFSIEGGTDIQIPGFRKSGSDSKSSPEVVISEDPNQVHVREYEVGEIQIKVEKISGSPEAAPTSEKVVLPAITPELREIQGELAGIDKLLEEVESETASVLIPAMESIEMARSQRDQIIRRQSDFWKKINPSKEERCQLETVINEQMNTTVSPIALRSGKPGSIGMPDFVRLVLWQQKKMQAEEIVRKTEVEYKNKRAELIEKLHQQKQAKLTLQTTPTTNFYEQVIDLVLSVCPGYEQTNAQVPYEKLLPLLPLLDQYRLGRTDEEIWEMAENRWKKNRPCVICVIKEDERLKQEKAKKERQEQERLEREKAEAERKRKEWLRQTGQGEKAGERRVEKISGVEYAFRWCPPGTFMMGDEGSQHQVTLTKGFWMLETPVTQLMWKSVMRTGWFWSNRSNNPSSFIGDNLPVEMVSWNDCQKFIRKLNGLFKSSLQFRLPTEAEWEYACRAGTTTAYSFGNSLNGDKANCNGNYPHGTNTEGPYLHETTPVMKYAPNAWGLYDMHGNVWERCEDWYGDYPSGSATDPKGAESGSNRVNRGGSWFNYAKDCRSAFRIRSTPGYRCSNVGFRLALSSTH